MFGSQRLLTAAALSLLFLAPTAHAATVGNDLIDRSFNPANTSSGNDYVLDQALPVGELVSTWGIYNDNAAVVSNLVTPFLATQIGTILNVADEPVPVFQIIAYGTTRAIDDSGAQTWNFDVVAGSVLIGPNTYFGWRDGGVLEGQKGGSVTDYDTGLADGAVRTWFTHGSELTGNPVAIGTELPTRATHSIAFLFNRTYSAQVTTIPEPATLALIGLGGLLILRRRQHA